MPLTVNMLYLLGIAFGSDELPSVLHLTLTVLVTTATFAFGRRYFGVRAGWMAAIASVSTLLLVVFAAVPNVEYGLALFDFLAVFAFVRWHGSRQRGWLAASGGLMGLSLGSKYASVSATGVGIPSQATR